MTESHQYNLEKWKLLIQDQKQSGLKVVEWCRQNGYTKHAYYYWARKVQQEILPAALEQLSNSHSQLPLSQPSFVDVTPTMPATIPSAISDQVESAHLVAAIIRKNGFEAELTSNASAELVKTLLECMSYA